MWDIILHYLFSFWAEETILSWGTAEKGETENLLLYSRYKKNLKTSCWKSLNACALLFFCSLSSGCYSSLCWFLLQPFSAENLWKFLSGKFGEYILQLQWKSESQNFIFCIANKEYITLNPLTNAAVFLPFPSQSHSIINLLWELFLLCQQKICYHEITAYTTSWSVGLLWLHFISSS